jgi:pimeloyl-ACP methyl ester carboxylesterase
MKRRDLAAALGAAAAVALGGHAAAQAQPAKATGKTYVLIHGAFHGGWCWQQVAARLRAAGHVVYTPTLTGAGERSHLLSETVTLDTWTKDILNVIRYEELSDVILIGHSFGGLTVSAVADKAKDRLRHLVYLDALMVGRGHSTFDERAPEDVGKSIAVALQTSGGLTLPPPPPAAYGVTDPAAAARVARLLTPQPLAVYLGKLQLDNPVGNGLPATYIGCTDPPLAAVAASHTAAQAMGWTYLTIRSGHDAMIIAPDELAGMLAQIG